MPILSISTEALRDAMAPEAVPGELAYEELHAPFRIDLTFGDWQVSGLDSPVRITIASGLLRDVDKGPFPLDRLQLAIHLHGTHVEAVEVLNPGLLSELQQAGLLDAVATALDASSARGLRVVGIEPESAAGLLATHAGGTRATIILGNGGQSHGALIRTSAGTLHIAESTVAQQSQLLVLSGPWTSH